VITFLKNPVFEVVLRAYAEDETKFEGVIAVALQS
jgi:hypothetical protein